ncbi:MAG TPA: DUF4349 domain-containing protein [Gemmatimonadaceae bacterium]|nr:DUF4349 domain-containing protein [Gemmatimonadaceae bacterium]
MKMPMIMAAALALAASCTRGISESGADSAVGAADLAMSSPPPPMAAPFRGEIAAQRQALAPLTQSVQTPTVDQKVIRTGELRIELDDVGRAVRVADSIAAAMRGSVANSRRFHGENGATEAAMVLRIPADRFAATMEALRPLGRVRVDNANADDVTRAYTDLEIRLAVKRDVVARLRALLTNRTARLSDLIEAERELGRAVAELEQMEGERRYLDNQIALSTIHVTFYHAPIAGPGSFLDPVAVAIRQTLMIVGRSVATIITAVAAAAPWVVLALGLWWILRRAVRRRSPAPAAPVNT